MDLTGLKSSLIAKLYDSVSMIPFGDGVLISTPFAYSDGDNVVVAVFPFGEGVRVTDREESIDRLEDAGVDIEKNRRARDERLALVRGAHLVPLGAEEFELSQGASLDGAADAILTVAALAQQIEQLRYLARETPTRLYRDVVMDNARAIAHRHEWKVKASPEIKLRNGRRRHVTARVQTDHATAYVQALSNAEAIATTFLTYSYFEIDPRLKLAVVDERNGAWHSADLDPIRDSGTLVHYRNEGDLAAALERVDRQRPNVFI